MIDENHRHKGSIGDGINQLSLSAGCGREHVLSKQKGSYQIGALFSQPLSFLSVSPSPYLKISIKGERYASLWMSECTKTAPKEIVFLKVIQSFSYGMCFVRTTRVHYNQSPFPRQQYRRPQSLFTILRFQTGYSLY